MDIVRWLTRFKAVVWLTWKEQSGWTKPPYYFGYIIITPFFQLILYAYMYIVIAFYSGLVNVEMAYYLVTGVSLYNFIGAGLYGLIWTVHSEREHFRTLKYTYMAFPNLQLYLLSRGFFHYITGALSTLVMLLSGLILTGVPLGTLSVKPMLLTILIILGFLWSSQLGIMVAGSSIFSSEYGPLISEAVGGILFLLGAVLYPIESLPEYIRPFADVFPMREWMELMRYALNPAYNVADPNQLLLQLVVKTIIYVIAAVIFFRFTEKLARKKGLLEATLHH
jgi:ABC-type polysaccharide/polyol phosphate export permease